MDKEPENSAGRKKTWPAEEDRFHEPFVESEAVDGALTIAINERNEVRAGDGSRREPPRTHALKGFFSDD